MSEKPNKSQENKQDVHDVIKKNFETYFQEVQKVMPQYHQSFTTLQENFLGAWKKTINSSIELQKEWAKNANIETNIPKEYANMIQSISEEYIKSKDIQNQFVLTTLETINNNVKNHHISFESAIEFNKKIFSYWTNLYSKKD